jgi:hypothetical protein
VQFQSFQHALQGGDRRSVGNANEVAELVLRRPGRLPELIRCFYDPDPIVRMRAADAAEKVSTKKPELIEPFKGELLSLAAQATQQELRWHLALMLPRLSLTAGERRLAIAAFREYLGDKSSIVKTCALQTLVELSRGSAELEAATLQLLENALRTGTPAMKARGRQLLAALRKS